jgi:polyribonucleotide nucleotidyltransferase
MQPVIDAIIELADHAAKEPFDFEPEDTDAIKAGDEEGRSARTWPPPSRSRPRASARTQVAEAKAKLTDKFGKSDENPAGIAPDKLGGGLQGT